jgi:hypothetical protein
MIKRLLAIAIIGLCSTSVYASNDISDGLNTLGNDNLIMADNNRKERRDGRQDNRDDKQDCRQEEGRVGDDKRECKQGDGGEGDKEDKEEAEA